MNNYYNEEAKCLVVDLRDCTDTERRIYEDILDKSGMTQESYEDNLYHIYGSEDEVSPLEEDLDDVEAELEDIYDLIEEEVEEELGIEY